MASTQPWQTTLSRPADDRVIAGVCAGLARRFGLSAVTVRLLFVLSLLLPGPQVLIYLVLWILMPEAPRVPAAPRTPAGP
jgi:phage shock protein PspC (stress-responsive transcriptional regulator)